MIRFLIVGCCTLLLLVTQAAAQGEYLSKGQGGLGIGTALQSGRGVSTWTFAAGACFRGKSDLTLAYSTINNHSPHNDEEYGIRFRTFFKGDSTGQSFFGSLDLSMEGGHSVLASAGGTAYGNVQLGRTKCLQATLGAHVMMDPEKVMRGSLLSFMTVACVTVAKTLKSGRILFAGVSVRNYSAGHGQSSAGAGVGMAIPIGRLRDTESW